MTAIGIDLGTTNSVAAWCHPERREARILSTSVGESFTPSVVCFKRPRREGQEGEILVGRPALNYAPTAPEETILSIKRLMGRSLADLEVEAVTSRFSYPVVAGPDGDPRAHVRLGGELHTPAEVSAWILRRIREDATRALGDEVTHAVITVPAYFNEGQRAATREAGERAGLVVKKVIDEPTAAAVAFGFQATGAARHRLLVYDLGGGTFDISLVQMARDVEGRDQFQGLHIEGDNWLGGDDFDRPIVEKIIAWVKEETGEDPAGDRRFLFLARRAAEEAKRALGHSAETNVVIPAAYKARGVFVDVDFPLTRDDFEEMIRGPVERSMELVTKALQEEGLTPEEVTEVLMVGGATLTPLVAQRVEGLFGAAKVRRTVNPMECVALGAAILAATLEGVECPDPECREINDEAATECAKCGGSLAAGRSVGTTGVTEPTAMSLGIAAVQGARKDVFVPIIPKGTVYPLREPMKKRFQALDDRRIVVPVYEGDDPVASRNSFQGTIEYELPEKIDVDTPVEVGFNYDRNRQLTVIVSIPGTNLHMSELLRRDRPAPAPEVESEPPESEESWQDELADVIEYSRRFLDHYGRFMEPHETVRFKRNVDQAMHLLSFPEEVEGRKMVQRLQYGLFNSGLATQLYLSDRVADGGSSSPEESKLIRQSAEQVRKSFERGDREAVEEQSRALKVLVAKSVERRAGIREIADQEDYGGLLRWLGE
jgi:molecular chaperone DnaK (HSP70)